ncbi:MAG: PQQ-binding-like beta-propeller repeat protein [Hydrogenophaga sp.]|nr:PQQ-binding-like beta-propeller repeat protein [Hydrogenophaga sp.]MDP3923521.1 PQQ-binding-like beta-propeller repeat protein [Hydrogenophaga sp.]
MSVTPHTLSRAQTQTAFGRFLPKLSEGSRRLAEQLLQQLGPTGDVSVAVLHSTLFPLASTKSASAQLTKLLANIASAAQASGLTLSHEYTGSKQAGTAQRKLRFLGPPPMLRAETETLDAIAPAQRIEGQLADPLYPAHRVILVTFNDHEFNAVRKAFWPYAFAPKVQHKLLAGGTTISADDLGQHDNLHVLHHHSRQGNRESQRAVSDLLAAFQPRAVVAVGIAFGVDPQKQQLGDVLVSKFIVDYEMGKVHQNGKLSLRGPRPVAPRAWLRALEQLDTRNKSSVQTKTTWPSLHFGGLLSGEKLVDAIDYRDSLKTLVNQDDIVGGEMEAVGLLTALDGTHTDWLVVKAICDWADGHKSQDKERRQQDAAENAAQVVKALIDSGSLYPDDSPDGGTPPPRQRSTPKTARDLMSRARLSEMDPCVNLSTGQTATTVNLDTLSENAHKIGEVADDASGIVAFDDILEWSEAPDGPPLYALLGEYGMGKTTTSQRVFEHIRTQYAAGQTSRPALYFDLRKVERLVAASDTAPGQVPQLAEVIEDCLRHGYLSDGPEPPSLSDVLHTIDQGALVIFDGLDEVLSRLQDKQGLTFTANLLRVLPDAQARRRPDASSPKPKVLLSCRTQFFRSLNEQHNHLTGEHRGAQPASQYRAVVLRPFNEEQIRAYLKAALPHVNLEDLMQRIASVHNLTDLSKRPFTLKLVARFLPQIERWQAEGRSISGATLYRQVAREWLIRDKEKQSFHPEDKEQLAAALAAHLWQTQQRGLSAKALETWLGTWLAQQPPGSDCLTQARNLLQQDLRNATFLRRIDDGPDSRFEFSHSSLQEFFLAEHLARQVLLATTRRSNPAELARRFETWAGPPLSDETLDFLIQILGEQTAQPGVTEVLNAWRKTYRPQASELLLRYALQAPASTPRPLLAGFDLRGAQLRNWMFDGHGRADSAAAPLPMQGCLLQGADLRGARFRHVRLDDADFSGTRLEQASFEHCRLQHTRWAGAHLVGTVFRHCTLQGSQMQQASAYRAQFTACAGAPPAAQPDQPAAWLVPPNHETGAVAGQRLAWLTGHNNGVNAVAFSPDGLRIVSASRDNTLCLWDAASGEALMTLSGHNDWVNAVAFSPDGHRIASASRDNSWRLWDADTGEALMTLSSHSGWVHAVAFSHDGQRIASGDYTLHLWDATSGKDLMTLSRQSRSVHAMAFSPDGKRIISASNDNTLRLWDTATGEALLTLSGQSGGISAVTFSPDGQRIASASRDGTLRLWDAATGEALMTISGHSHFICAISFTPDGQRIASASYDKTLCLWDAASGEALMTFSGHSGPVHAVTFSPNGQRIVSASRDNTLRLWDAATGEALMTLNGHDRLIRAVAFSPDGQRIAAASFDNTLRLWCIASGKPLMTLSGHRGWVRAVAFSQDGQRIASASSDGTLHLWDAASGEALMTLSCHSSTFMPVAFSPDGQRIVSVSDDNTIRLQDTVSGEVLLTLNGHNSSVTAVAFSPDGQRIASASSGKTLILWNANSGEALVTLNGHSNPVRALAFSPDGQHIVSASRDNTLRLWDAATGEFLMTFSGHSGSVIAVVFSPDGQRIATASSDSTLRLWDAHTGACNWLQEFWAQTLDGLNSHATWVPPGVEAAHPEGRVISASGDAWRVLGWQAWDHASAPGQWTRLPLGAYPGEEGAD